MSQDHPMLRGRGEMVLATIVAALSFPVSAAPSQSAPPVSERAPEARLSAKTITLPVVMVREFPFVEGEVAGIKGKFLLDTGMQDSMVLNDHRVPLKGGTKIGTGFFGSGQTFDVRLNAIVNDVRVANIRLARVSSIRSQDARQLEGITPDFLGWVGYGFFGAHALKVDYRRSQVTFYTEGPEEYLRDEKIVAELPFETRKLPNHPLLAARIGDVDAIISLDTGQEGHLTIPANKKQRLLAEGMLRPTKDQDKYDVIKVRIADRVDVNISAVEVAKGPSPAAKPIGITEDTQLSLGYALLRQYKTVWDYRSKRIYLLTR